MPPSEEPAREFGAIPRSGRDLQPLLWEVIERWHSLPSAPEDWSAVGRQLPSGHQDWPGLVARLQLINTYQWHQEDRSRDPEAGDAVLAAVKRSIDASNRRRVQAVADLDELIHARLQETGCLAADAPLNSESPGSIIDRLTVLALKIYHLKDALATARQQPPAPNAGAEDDELLQMYERLRSLAEQMVDLTGCLDRLLEDIPAGRMGLKLYRPVKIYRNTATGRLQADIP